VLLCYVVIDGYTRKYSLSREILSGGNFDVEKLLTLDLVRKKYIKYIRSSINIQMLYLALLQYTSE